MLEIKDWVETTIDAMVSVARGRGGYVPVVLSAAGFTSAEIIEHLPDVMKRLSAPPQSDALIERLARLEDGIREAIRIYDDEWGDDLGNWSNATQVLRVAIGERVP